MKITDLKSTAEEYSDNIDEWQFLKAAYNGAKALIDYGIIKQHERESIDNYNNRKDNAFGFSYSKAVVNLFAYYLFSKQIDRVLDKLGDDEQWKMFTEDCDLEGTNFDQFFQGKMNQVVSLGQYGFLVDKSPVVYDSQATEINNNVYPYIAAYSPENILDWTYDRDENNRPYLSYLKLKDDNDLYHLWWPNRWETWREPDAEDGVVMESAEAELIAGGTNSLNEIPFIWLYNIKSETKGVGISDIVDISRIDVSIMRNLSQGEEVIDYSAFPMMRKPKEPIDAPDETGVKAILTFDPDTPEAKPDWLDAKCLEPINAILLWVDRKVQEIYRVANTGGMNATEVQTQAKSGAALQIEFRMLNALLVNKAKNLKECQERIIYFWLKWQNMEDQFSEISLKAPESFDVENLTQDLENILLAKTIVTSDLFAKAIQKRVARQLLPEVSDEEIFEIDKEIDISEVPVYEPPEEIAPEKTEENTPIKPEENE